MGIVNTCDPCKCIGSPDNETFKAAVIQLLCKLVGEGVSGIFYDWEILCTDAGVPIAVRYTYMDGVDTLTAEAFNIDGTPYLGPVAELVACSTAAITQEILCDQGTALGYPNVYILNADDAETYEVDMSAEAMIAGAVSSGSIETRVYAGQLDSMMDLREVGGNNVLWMFDPAQGIAGSTYVVSSNLTGDLTPGNFQVPMAYDVNTGLYYGVRIQGATYRLWEVDPVNLTITLIGDMASGSSGVNIAGGLPINIACGPDGSLYASFQKASSGPSSINAGIYRVNKATAVIEEEVVLAPWASTVGAVFAYDYVSNKWVMFPFNTVDAEIYLVDSDFSNARSIGELTATGGRPQLLTVFNSFDPTTTPQFLRTYVKDNYGVTTAVVDTALDGVTPYTVIGDPILCCCTEEDTSTEAVFDPAVKITTIDPAYALAVDLSDDTKTVTFDNQTDGDVWVSMDGGISDHFHIRSGDTVPINLTPLNLKTTAVIHVKDGTVASSAGTFYIYAMR